MQKTKLEDRYEIQEKLGEGGFGIVYRALKKGTQKPYQVAIKKMREELEKDAALRERFLQEVQVVLTLQHENIVGIREFEEDELWFAMEYLNGETLSQYQAKQPNNQLSEAELLQILIPVCSGIEFAHRKGIIHRDLKPQNIIIVREVDGSLTPKVLDFGLAKDLSLSVGSNSSQAMGSEGFAAPEQYKGLKHTDKRTDVFALGAIAYYGLVGIPPLGRFDTSELSSGMRDIIDTALESNPDKRYQDAASLKDALTELKRSLPLQPRGTPKTNHEKREAPSTKQLPSTEFQDTTGAIAPKQSSELKPTQPHSLTMIGAIAGAVLVLAVGGYFLFGGKSKTDGTKTQAFVEKTNPSDPAGTTKMPPEKSPFQLPSASSLFGTPGPIKIDPAIPELEIGMMDHAHTRGWLSDSSEFGYCMSTGSDEAIDCQFKDINNKIKSQPSADTEQKKKEIETQLQNRGFPSNSETWAYASDLELVWSNSGSKISIGARVLGESRKTAPLNILNGHLEDIIISPDGKYIGAISHSYAGEYTDEFDFAVFSIDELAGKTFNATGLEDYHKKGQYSKSKELFLKAATAEPSGKWNFFNLACAAAKFGDVELAEASLLQVIKQGNSDIIAKIKTDTDLDSLRTLPWFQELVK